MNAGRKLATIFGLAAACAFGCSNVLESAAKKTTDEAYYEEATKAVNNSRFDDAIASFELLSADFLAQTRVREDYAGALAGKCGLRLIEFVQALEDSSGSIFKFAMNAWTGKEISPAHCLAAENQIRILWTTGTPSAKQKFFMAILGLAKMGAYLRSKADVDGDGNLGDGSTDADFNACLSTAGDHNLEDDEVGQVLTGLMSFVTNVTDFAADLGGAADTTSIQQMCDDVLDADPTAPNLCAYTDWAAVPTGEKADIVALFRALLATGATSKDDPPLDPSNDLRQTLGIGSPWHAANGAVLYQADGSCARDPFLLCCQ